MNKKIAYIGLLAVGALLNVACTDNVEIVTLGNEQIQFTGAIGIDALVQSRSEDTDDPFVENGVMGVYAYRVEGGTLYEANGINHPYKYAGISFTDEASATPLYWPTKGNLNFVAYSPYKTDLSAVTDVSAPILYSLDMANQGAEIGTDLLIATKSDIGGSHEPVHLTFNHALSRLNIILEGAFGMEFAPQPVVWIKGLQTKGNVRIALDGFSIENLNTVTDITPYRLEPAGTRRDSVSMIIIPQELNVNEEMEFIHIENQLIGQERADKYLYKISPTSVMVKGGKLTFEPGKEYKLVLTLKNKEAEIKNAYVTITPWTGGGSADGSGDAYWPEINN